jgi:RNA polymerase sigma factor (sigma-70 family)
LLVGHETLDFSDFYQSSWASCRRALLASGIAPAAAEDQLAEAFARAWVSWRRVSVHPAPRAWVLRTALNVGTSLWRRRKHEVSFAGQDRPSAPDEMAGIDQGLLRAVQALPAREREVLVLRLLLDLDTNATARELAIAPGTVRAHLAHAVATLRTVIPPIEEEVRQCPTTTQ